MVNPAGLLKTQQSLQVALVVSVPAELDPTVPSNCSSDGADRMGVSEKNPRGVHAKCVGVCVRVTKWSVNFQNNRDA